MNRQFITGLNVAHVLRREEAKLPIRFLLGLVQQQHRHHVPIDLIGKDIVLVQEVERRIHAGPQCNQERHRRVGSFPSGQGLGVTNRIGNVIIARNNRKGQGALFGVHYDFTDEATQLHHTLLTVKARYDQ